MNRTTTIPPEITIIDGACPLCAMTERELLVEGLVDVEDRVPGRYNISRCANCRLVYLSRRPAEDSLPQCYPPHYHVHDPARRRNPIPDYLYRLRLQARYRRVRRNITNNCRALLEIGCGDGSFLRYLDQQMRAEVRLTGIDLLVPATAPAANSRLTLIAGEFEKTEFDGTHDAVMMFNVLEHIAAPVTVLRRIANQLQPGGVLCGEVPNWDSCWRKVFPRHWQGLQIPRHQTQFEPASLQRMLQTTGFEAVTIRLVYDPGDLSVSLCNWITYRLKLKTPPRRAWFYFPVLLLAAPVVWLVNQLTRGAGSIEFVARKST